VSIGKLVTLLYILRCTSYSSIHSYDITISGLEKQTSAVLAFYFRFRFQPYHCTCIWAMSFCIRLHNVAFLCDESAVNSNQPTCIRLSNFMHIGAYLVELWCYINFQDGGRWGTVLLPVTDWLTSLFRRLMSISKPDFAVIAQSTSELYFRFGTTNVRHIVIYLPVANLIMTG